MVPLFYHLARFIMMFVPFVIVGCLIRSVLRVVRGVRNVQHDV
jgi:hypothetical protein